ncbi:hypothetical protein AR687_09815 [Flavobacteriaceae bacterium CRH]|nr:hypothetical protein AR687_09815 [Flavobacteriaceae bacterium CRH]
MKRLIISYFILLFSPIQAQNLQVKDLQILITKGLPKWTNSFENFKWDDFIKVDSIADFDKGLKENFKSLKKFQTVYDPIISYSESRNKFIDIYSYQLNLEKKNGKYYSNIDVGQVIYLCDINNKVWERIAYNEYSKSFDDVIWINENKFLLVGYEKNESNKNAPIIYIGNIKEKSFKIVVNSNVNCFQKEQFYQSEKLKNIQIQHK